MVNIQYNMKNRGFYIKEDKERKVFYLFIHKEQFKTFLDELGQDWQKFVIYENKDISAKFSHNIKRLEEHE